MDPYRIQGPAKISFSGGRTSGFMLWSILRAWDGKLPDDVRVAFANTGKEREETLRFVHEIETRWSIPITWLERRAFSGDVDGDGPSYRVVTFETASRDGAPFRQLIVERNFLPNPVTRFCTQELKIRVMKAWMMAQGHEHWTNVIGLRADEPKRVARMRASEGRDRWDVAMPLATAGVRVADVDAFWAAQPFDLGLEKWEGNCDLCFLKGRAKRTRIMRDRPDLASWWIGIEHIALRAREPGTTTAKVIDYVEDPGAPSLPFDPTFLRRVVPAKPLRLDASGHFRYDAPAYEDLLTISQHPMLDLSLDDLEGEAVDDIGDCFCNAA